jgi:hypothetical protein
MHLHAYLKEADPAERDRLAAACGTTLNYLWKLARGAKRGLRPHPELATRLEVATNRKVRRWESIPEAWHAIWPELAQLPDAPQITLSEDKCEGVLMS